MAVRKDRRPIFRRARSARRKRLDKLALAAVLKGTIVFFTIPHKATMSTQLIPPANSKNDKISSKSSSHVRRILLHEGRGKEIHNPTVNSAKHISLLIAFCFTAFTAFGDLDADFSKLLDSGAEKYSRRDLDGALADFSKAIQIKPDSFVAYNQRGVVRHTQGDFDGAISDYNKAIELKPNYLAYYNRGYTKEFKRDWNAAIADFTKSIELNSAYVLAYIERGNTLQAKGDLDNAIADFSKAIELNPKYSTAYYNRGNARRLKRDLDGALDDYDKAINLEPDFVSAYDNRAFVRRVKGDLTGSNADLKKARDLKEKSTRAVKN